MSRAKTEYRYEKLTWPEINDAIDLGKVCIVPCGAVEQHGPHLPLDVDLVCPGGIAKGAGQNIPDKILVLPIVAYGYTGHVMDFPGTINNDFEHFMHHVLHFTKSLVYQHFTHMTVPTCSHKKVHSPTRPRCHNPDLRLSRPPHQSRNRCRMHVDRLVAAA